MSVLPQLERELSAAHARRRRPRVRLAGAPVVVAVAVAVAVVLVAVAAPRPGRSPQRPAAPASVVYRGYLELPFAAAGSLYGFASDRPDSPAVTGASHLVRIDPSSGRVVARQGLAPPAIGGPGRSIEQPDAVPQHVLLAAGSLWITATDSRQTWLLRLDPNSLAVRSLRVLPGGGVGNTGALAVAGGWLWTVNVNTLIRVSPATGRLAGSRVFSHAEGGQGNSIAADPSGETLIATVANYPTFSAPGVVRGDPGSRVYRLDPRTGLPIASSAKFDGFVPELAGVLGGGAWINGLTRSAGPARVDVRTLKVSATVGRSPLTAQVLGGVVVVARRGTVSCVDPLSGRTLAPLPDLVAAEGTTAYVQVERGGAPEIRRATLDPRCLGGGR